MKEPNQAGFLTNEAKKNVTTLFYALKRSTEPTTKNQVSENKKKKSKWYTDRSSKAIQLKLYNYRIQPLYYYIQHYTKQLISN